MLTAEGCAARRERLWEALPAACDVLIVGDPSHLIYFAGYVPSPFVFRTVESGALLLLEPGRATLVADDMLGPFLEQAFVDERGRPGLVRRQRTRPRIAGASSSQSALDRLAKIPGRRIGVELSSVPAGVVEGLRAGAAGARDRRHRPADPAAAAVEGPRRDRRSSAARCAPARRRRPRPWTRSGRA